MNEEEEEIQTTQQVNNNVQQVDVDPAEQEDVRQQEVPEEQVNEEAAGATGAQPLGPDGQLLPDPVGTGQEDDLQELRGEVVEQVYGQPQETEEDPPLVADGHPDTHEKSEADANVTQSENQRGVRIRKKVNKFNL